MAYDALTPERFKTFKPQFDGVDDEVVQTYIDMASRFVDQSWAETDYEAAWIAVTCHLMTLDGQGDDEASKSFATGAAEFQTIKSADLTLTRYQRQSESMGSFTKWLSQTNCGRFYSILLQMNRGGPRIAMGTCGFYPSGYAKDWPLGTGGWQNGPLP